MWDYYGIKIGEKMLKRVITKEQRNKLIEKKKESKLLEKLIKILIRKGIIIPRDLQDE